jgi:hypothetical protein
MRGSVEDPLERRIASSLLKNEVKDVQNRLSYNSNTLSGLSNTRSLSNIHLSAY